MTKTLIKVLETSAKRHGSDHPLTLEHFLNIVKLAQKTEKRMKKLLFIIDNLSVILTLSHYGSIFQINFVINGFSGILQTPIFFRLHTSTYRKAINVIVSIINIMDILIETISFGYIKCRFRCSLSIY